MKGRYGRLKKSAMFWCGKDQTNRVFSEETLVVAKQLTQTLWVAHPVDAPGYARHFSERKPMLSIRWLSPLEILALTPDLDVETQ